MEIDRMSTAGVRHRSPALAQAVSAPLARAAIFLVATLNPGAETRAILRSFCGDLAKLVRTVVLFALIELGALFRLPEADSDDSVGSRVQDHHDRVHKAMLLPENRQELVVDGVAESACFAGFAGSFNDSRTHDLLLLMGKG